LEQCSILAVDDEQNILNSLIRLFRSEGYKLFTAINAEKGLEILKGNKIQLVISDYRMPEIDGVKFLQRVKGLYPDAIRIVLSGYADVSAIIDAINKGEIYKFITKPWNDEELKLAVRRSLEQYELIQENRRLTERIRLQNEELEKQVRERTATLALAQEILENLPLGVIGISTEQIIVFINRKVKDIFQQQAESLIGLSIEEFIALDLRCLVEGAFKTNQVQKVERFEHKGAYYSLTCSPLFDHDNLKGATLIVQGEAKNE
jgi:PAS domain S-box-containing protein